MSVVLLVCVCVLFCFGVLVSLVVVVCFVSFGSGLLFVGFSEELIGKWKFWKIQKFLR